MSAEATVVITDANWESGFTVPVQALLAAEEENQAYIFVYDPHSSTIKKTIVRFHGMEKNKVIVEEGLQTGDTIAVAGVSFLADGMTVKLMDQ